MMSRIKIFFAFLLVLSLIMSFSGCANENVQNNSGDNAIASEISGEISQKEKAIKENATETTPVKQPDKQENHIPVVKEEKSVSDEIEVTKEKTETKGLFCTLSVRCDRVFNDISRLDDAKISLIPENGIIFPETSVEFFEGESVFNVLTRELKKKKIHIEFVTNPMYNSAYVEGISNLYEFDCGANSGWVYLVNGKSPPCGSSQYMLKNKDKIEWVYICN